MESKTAKIKKTGGEKRDLYYRGFNSDNQKRRKKTQIMEYVSSNCVLHGFMFSYCHFFYDSRVIIERISTLNNRRLLGYAHKEKKYI